MSVKVSVESTSLATLPYTLQYPLSTTVASPPNWDSKTRTCLKSHHKWPYRRLRATRLLVILPSVLHRKGSKGPRKPIRGPYTGCPALSQEQSTTSSRHFLRQTKPPKGGPETTSVMDNVSKNKTCPPCFFLRLFFSGAGGEGGKGSTEAPQAHLSADTPSIWWLTRQGVIQTQVENMFSSAAMLCGTYSRAHCRPRESQIIDFWFFGQSYFYVKLNFRMGFFFTLFDLSTPSLLESQLNRSCLFHHFCCTVPEFRLYTHWF
jgi:hypothetical protein